MKKIAWFMVLCLMVFGFQGNVPAYEGGTKMIATMAQPQSGRTGFAPIAVVPQSELGGTKLVVQLLRQMPQPTLSTGQLRDEKSGSSTGTKGIVHFRQQGWF